MGFLGNELWRSMHVLTDEFSKLLSDEHGVVAVDVLRSGPFGYRWQSRVQGPPQNDNLGVGFPMTTGSIRFDDHIGTVMKAFR